MWPILEYQHKTGYQYPCTCFWGQWLLFIRICFSILTTLKPGNSNLCRYGYLLGSSIKVFNFRIFKLWNNCNIRFIKLKTYAANSHAHLSCFRKQGKLSGSCLSTNLRLRIWINTDFRYWSILLFQIDVLMFS